MKGRLATIDEVKAIQRVLRQRGFYAGDVDGAVGKRTIEAIRLYQAAKGHPVTSILTSAELVDLGLLSPPPPKRNTISDFFTNLIVKKGVGFLTANLKGAPAMNVLSGYKTYIVAVLVVLCSAAETFIPGLDVPGYNLEFGEAVMLALAFFTGRAGATADAVKAATGKLP